MANTFLYANKVNVGISFVEKDLLKNAIAIQTKARKYKCKLILPVDAVCSKKLTDKINIRCCEINNVLQDHMILDVGEKTIQIIKNEILKSQILNNKNPYKMNLAFGNFLLSRYARDEKNYEKELDYLIKAASTAQLL